MEHIFSDTGLKAIEKGLSQKIIFAFDFDGTLAKMVNDPGNAILAKTTRNLLSELNGLAPIFIVSSRPREDLNKRIRIKSMEILPNFGIEKLISDKDKLTALVKICQGWKEILQQTDFGPGVILEDKIYSLALHYKKSITKYAVSDTIWKVITKFDPKPNISKGKFVFNFWPPGYPNKASAIIQGMESVSANGIFYIGDDESDEHVFSLSDSSVLGIRIAFKEASKARFYMAQHEMNKLLSLILELIKKKSAISN